MQRIHLRGDRPCGASECAARARQDVVEVAADQEPLVRRAVGGTEGRAGHVRQRRLDEAAARSLAVAHPAYLQDPGPLLIAAGQNRTDVIRLALDLMKTKHVVDNGLSVVDPKKLQFTIDSIADAYKLPSEPDSSTVYTDKFLPPLAEGMAKTYSWIYDELSARLSPV